MGFNLDDYEPVASRFSRFIEWANAREEFFSVTSELLSIPGADICVFKTSILCDGVLVATGHAEEVRGAGNVNRTSSLENCETSSLGRCLSNFPLHNFAGSDFKKRPSREEMSKVQNSAGNFYQTDPALSPLTNVKRVASISQEGVRTFEDGTMKAPDHLLGVAVKGKQHGELPDWFLQEAFAAGVKEVYDNRAEVAGTKRPWFKATTGGKDAKAFWPPRGTPDPQVEVESPFGDPDEEPF
jgi:hypothetical protein